MLSRAFVLAAVASLSLAACKKKEAAPAKDEPKPSAPAAEPVAAAEPAKDEPKKLPEVEMVEHDLSPFGAAFAGYVVTAPKDAKLEYDDPSRHIVLSDTDYVDIAEAPGWADAVKTLEQDKDNQNIKKVSDTEYRWQRTPPLGKAWLVDAQVTLGKSTWSCGTGMTGTFHSEAMADRIATICKSIKKK